MFIITMSGWDAKDAAGAAELKEIQLKRQFYEVDLYQTFHIESRWTT